MEGKSMTRLWVFVLLLCGTAYGNDWQTLHTNHDSGAHCYAALVFFDPETGEDVWDIKHGTAQPLYSQDFGHYATAERRLDGSNWCKTQCWGGGTLTSEGEWHHVSVQVGRSHDAETDEPLAYTEAVNWHDAMGVVSIEAKKDGLATCRIIADQWRPGEHSGPEPQMIDGLTLRASIHGTWVRYTFNSGLWRWEREGEYYKYNAETGENEAVEIPWKTYGGFRGIDQESFDWQVRVTESDIVEIYADANGSGWEMFDSIGSQQSGTSTSSTDVWDMDAAVKKEIEDLP